MTYSIKAYPAFNRAIKQLGEKYHSIKNDYQALLEELKANPHAGVDLGHGIRKVRMKISSKGKGKSGGARVITLLVSLSESEGEIGLHYIYDKSEKENISDTELQEILQKNGVL